MREKELCMLRRLLETSDIKSKELIKSAPNSFINFLCESLLDVVNGNVPIKKTFVQGQKNSFKKLLSKQTSLKNKRQIFAKNRVLLKDFALGLPLSKEVIMYTEQFIIIPKRMFMSTQPAKSEIIDDPVYKQKATQLSLIQGNMFQIPEKSEKEDGAVQTEPSINVETVHEEKEEPMSDDSEIEPIVKKSTTTTFQSIMKDLGVMEKNKIARAEIILNKILESPTVSIEDPGGIINIDNQPLGLKASNFLYNTQQPTKKIDILKYYRALLALELSPHLVSNTYAKQILEASESEEDIFASPRGKSGSGYQVTNQTKTGTRKKTAKDETKTAKMFLLLLRKKTLDQLYLKGPASLGNPTRLKTQSNLLFDKIKTYLETKPSFRKYRPFR